MPAVFDNPVTGEQDCIPQSVVGVERYFVVSKITQVLVSYRERIKEHRNRVGKTKSVSPYPNLHFPLPPFAFPLVIQRLGGEMNTHNYSYCSYILPRLLTGPSLRQLLTDRCVLPWTKAV